MPRFRTVAGALLVIALVGALLRLGMWWVVESVSSPEILVAAGPHLQLVTDHLDLGRMEAGQTLQARFVIANSGKGELVFRQTPDACCSKGPLPPVTIVPPGRTDEIVLDVAWRELGAHGQQRFGFVTNDPARPEFWLVVRGSVTQPRRAEHSVLVKKP